MSPWDLLTGDAERDRRNVAILMESVEELYGPRDLSTLLTHAVDRAIRVTGAQRGVLLLRGADGRTAVRVARSSKGVDLPLTLRYSRSVVERVASSGEPHLTIDAEDPSSAALGQSILDLRLLSIMAVPLTVKSRSLGVLYVDSTVQAKEFTKSDFAVLRSLGGIIALAVESAELAQAQEARRRLEEQMSLARSIQQGLLPKHTVAPAGYDLAAEGQACEATSGDYYDVIPLADGRLGLVVGDVSGHGLGQALIMASTRAQVHALLRLQPSLVDVMRALNGFLERDLPRGQFMSLFLALLDPATRTLTYVSAGHNPPLWVRRSGALTELGRTGPVLGVLDDAEFSLGGPIVLGEGDALVLYTDGIFEAHAPVAPGAPAEEADIWGEERFQRSVVAHAGRSPKAQDVLRGVLADLGAFVRERALEDDVTCLVLRRLPGA